MQDKGFAPAIPDAPPETGVLEYARLVLVLCDYAARHGGGAEEVLEITEILDIPWPAFETAKQLAEQSA